MSNRTLIEINHDYVQDISNNRDAIVGFLLNYLTSGDARDFDNLAYYGIRIVGMKHHSDPHSIKWGSIEDKEEG